MSAPEIFHIQESNIEISLLRQAAEILIGGGVIAFPTETVYGIGCLISNKEAVNRIYSIKGRDRGKPLAVYLSDNRSLRDAIEGITPVADKLISAFLPGPLTLIFQNKEGKSTGYRISPNPVLRKLLELLPGPLVGTSANRSGGKDPTTADEVMNSIGESIDAIIDSGPGTGDIPSTVVDCTGEVPVVLREGRISAKEIELALK